MLNQPGSEQDHKNLLEQGFTLIELLIVIVILGILAGIVVFGVSNLTSDANKNACAAEVSTVRSAAEAFKARETVYPTSSADLTTGVVKGNTAEASQSGLASWPADTTALLATTPKNWVIGSAPTANQFQVQFLDAGNSKAFTITPGSSCS